MCPLFDKFKTFIPRWNKSAYQILISFDKLNDLRDSWSKLTHNFPYFSNIISIIRESDDNEYGFVEIKGSLRIIIILDNQ